MQSFAKVWHRLGFRTSPASCIQCVFHHTHILLLQTVRPNQTLRWFFHISSKGERLSAKTWNACTTPRPSHKPIKPPTWREKNYLSNGTKLLQPQIPKALLWSAYHTSARNALTPISTKSVLETWTLWKNSMSIPIAGPLSRDISRVSLWAVWHSRVAKINKKCLKISGSRVPGYQPSLTVSCLACQSSKKYQKYLKICKSISVYRWMHCFCNPIARRWTKGCRSQENVVNRTEVFLHLT